MVDTLSLEGKVAIITGSGREAGIGAATALALARNGASITINYISPSTEPQAVKVKEKIQQVGGKAIVVHADVTTPQGTAKLVKDTLEGFKTDKIDILSEWRIIIIHLSLLGSQANTLTSSPKSTTPASCTIPERSWRPPPKTLITNSPSPSAVPSC